MDPTVTVKNPHTQFESKDAKMTVIFFGRPVESTTDLYVMLSRSFDLPKLAPLASKAFEVGKITQAYDNRGYAKFGARYIGYVLLIHEEGTDRILASRSVPATLAGNHGSGLLSLKTKTTYDRYLREK